jgi:hypothetical protein
MLEEDLWRKNVFVAEYLQEVWDFAGGAFSLLCRGRRIGMGFKKTDHEGNAQLWWLKVRELERLSHSWETKVADTLRRLALPPERHGAYPFLQAGRG